MTSFDVVLIILGLLVAFVVYEYITNKALHTKMDMLLGRGTPAAATPVVDHAAIVKAAITGAVQLAAPSATAVAGRVPAQPLPDPIFDPAKYPDAGERLAAYQKLQGQLGLRAVIKSPQGNPIDVRGNEILPVTVDDGWVDKSELHGSAGGAVSCARNTFQAGVERVVMLHPDKKTLALYWSSSNVSNPSRVSCFITDNAGMVICPDKAPERRESTNNGSRGPVPCTPGAAYAAHITLDQGGSMDLVLREA